ncbi:MAG: phosphate ABC transporter ATP-binding protein PstB [Planctomycetaceae bacterium]|nr:phosphate ABC transporter ATP-binding protein PstB [Planctomycetaceae bacterium]
MEFTTKISIDDLNLFYGDFHALKSIQLHIPQNNVTALIGPSGCGKSTLLRTINRMNDLIENVRTEGRILIDGQNILDPSMDVVTLRQKVGMVFQRPNVFDQSILDNLLFGMRIHRQMRSRSQTMDLVHKSLEDVGLWDVLKDKLRKNARTLSLEQQQRLCIARVILLTPAIILFDEPCSALDPIATMRIEELLKVLREQYTLVIVTHNMQQAARASDYTGFLYLGELIEFGPTAHIFTNPRQKMTDNYISGNFG